MKTTLTILMVSVFQTLVNAQEKPKIFYEIVSEDSSVLFFNRDYFFTEKQCADYFRYTKVDSLGNFTGYFKDYTVGNELISTGYYYKGMKNGYFRFYYPDGKIKSKGSYRDNVPLGRWDYYYENGQLERVLMLTESDILIILQYDINGKPLIENGNGNFTGQVAGMDNYFDRITASGSIVNGKPDGKWTSKINGATDYCKEEFKEGQLVKGSFYTVVPGAQNSYSNRSFLNSFFLSNYHDLLEKFRFRFCSDIIKSDEPVLFDFRQFYTDLKFKIEKIIESDLRNNSIDNYTVRENYLTIQFTVDENGKPKDFRLISSFGNQLFYTIESAISTGTKFPPSINTMYFHLKLEFTDSYAMRMNFYFSKYSSMSR